MGTDIITNSIFRPFRPSIQEILLVSQAGKHAVGDQPDMSFFPILDKGAHYPHLSIFHIPLHP
jgi:hypothetical protein